MYESKCKLDSKASKNPEEPRQYHRIDIKGRVADLQRAMEKANYTKDTGQKMDKNDPKYGTPQEGTWTALRGQKAHTHVHKVKFATNMQSR